MDRDPSVCATGEDVGHYGGSYKVTKGLAEMHRNLGVLDTPIAENAFTGIGIGAAMTGLRPVVEAQFNQILNNCGVLHYTSGGQFRIPVAIRGPSGAGRQLGAERLQCRVIFPVNFRNPNGSMLNPLQCQGTDEGCRKVLAACIT